MRKLNKTEKKIVEMLVEGKQMFEIAMEISKPIPVTLMLIDSLFVEGIIKVEEVK